MMEVENRDFYDKAFSTYLMSALLIECLSFTDGLSLKAEAIIFSPHPHVYRFIVAALPPIAHWNAELSCYTRTATRGQYIQLRIIYCQDKIMDNNDHDHVLNHKCSNTTVSQSFKVRRKMHFDVSILWICVILIGSSLGQMAEKQEAEGLPDNVSDQSREFRAPEMGSSTQCVNDGDCKEGMKCEEGSCRVVPFQCESDADCSECNKCVYSSISTGYVYH